MTVGPAATPDPLQSAALQTSASLSKEARRIPGLSCYAEEALVTWLRLVADGEAELENRRACLCALGDFSPHEAFRALAAAAPGPTAAHRVTVTTLHAFVTQNSSALTQSATAHELGHAVLKGNAPPHGPGWLDYHGFLELVLPRDPRNRDLRSGALGRGEVQIERMSWPRPEIVMPHDVCMGLRRVIDQEVQFLKRLEKPGRDIRDNMTDEDVYTLLCGRSGVVSLAALQHFVAETLGALTIAQAAAIFRRLDPHNTRTADFPHVRALLRPFGDALAFHHKDDTPENRALALGVVLPTAAAPCTRESLQELMSHLQRQGEMDLYSFSTVRDIRESFDACPTKKTQVPKEALRTLLAHVALQGELDFYVEGVKERLRQKLPEGVLAPSAVFKTLDVGCHRYVSVAGLWQTLEEAGRPVRLPAVEALARSLRAGWRTRSRSGIAPMSFRDVCAIVLPSLSVELAAVQLSADDASARSELEVLATTAECPGCGARVQRSSDSVTCRSSTCSNCGVTMACDAKARDYDTCSVHRWGNRAYEEAITLDPHQQDALFEAVEQLLEAAVEREKNVSEFHCKPLYAEAAQATLGQALAELAGSAPETNSDGNLPGWQHGLLHKDDLQVALRKHGLWHSDTVMDLIWRRLAGHASSRTAQLTVFAKEVLPDVDA